MSNPQKLKVILVEDVDVLRRAAKNALKNLWNDQVEVVAFAHWPEFWDKFEGKKPVVLVISDINLKDATGQETISEGGHTWTITQFDGLRVAGFVHKRAPQVPCILYTAHDPAKNALDQFNSPDGIIWVVMKASTDDHKTVLAAATTKLGEVAQQILWSTPLPQRREILATMESASTNVNEIEVTPSGGFEKITYSAASVLTAISVAQREQQSDEAAVSGGADEFDLKSVLRPYLPSASKLLVLGRLLKPTDFLWPQETFGIREPAQWATWRTAESRSFSAVEAILHVQSGDGLTPCDTRDRCQQHTKFWDAVVCAARSDYSVVSPLLLDNTRKQFDQLWNKSHELKLTLQQGNMVNQRNALIMLQKTSRAVKTMLQDSGRWKSVVDEVFAVRIEDNGDEKSRELSNLLGRTSYAEWDAVKTALAKIVESVTENGAGVAKQELRAVVVPSAGIWTLSILIEDTGPGIQELAMHFAQENENRPMDAEHGHKLRLAQGLLWGYCRWAVFTKTESDTGSRTWDVYGESSNVGWCNSPGFSDRTGTIHVIEFDNPLLEGWSNGPKSFDL